VDEGEEGMTTTREQWLIALTDALRPAFKAQAKPLPSKIRLSVGYPSTGGKSKTIGQCHHHLSSADGHTEIFIRPDRHETLDVAAIVLHELCHAALGPGFKHGKEFKALATAMGLEGPMRSTTAGEAAIKLLRPLVKELKPFPHSALTLVSGGGPARPSDSTSFRNLNCPECRFHAKVRADQMSWGRLICPQCDIMLLMRGEEE
jgi:ssDNA-binding Zn-finger/Zn-ribbon topoisomerase 1